MLTTYPHYESSPMSTQTRTQPDITSTVRSLFKSKTAAAHASHVAIALPVILITLCCAATDALAEASRPTTDQVPLATLNGQATTLCHYQGKITVVNLWATWCAPYRKEMKIFEEAQRTHPQIAIVLVNQGETAAQAKEFLHAQNLTLSDVLLDHDMTMMATVDSVGLPTTTFYDKDGTQLESHLGEISAAELNSRLNALTRAGKVEG